MKFVFALAVLAVAITTAVGTIITEGSICFDPTLPKVPSTSVCEHGTTCKKVGGSDQRSTTRGCKSTLSIDLYIILRRSAMKFVFALAVLALTIATAVGEKIPAGGLCYNLMYPGVPSLPDCEDGTTCKKFRGKDVCL